MSSFKIRVAVILPTKQGLLLCQQNHQPFWVLPGGTLEAGEGVEACAIRELQEEAGLAITLDKLLYVADWLGPTRQVHELYFLGRVQSGTLNTQPVENIQHMAYVPLAHWASTPVQPQLIHQAIARDWPKHFAGVEGRVLGAFS